MTDEEYFARALGSRCLGTNCVVEVVDRCVCGAPVTKITHNRANHLFSDLIFGTLPIGADSTYDCHCVADHPFRSATTESGLAAPAALP